MDQPSGNGTITQEIQRTTHPSVIRPVDFPHNLSTNQLTNLPTNRPINSSSDHLRKFSQQIFERYINMTTNEPTKPIDQPNTFATDEINHSAFQSHRSTSQFFYWFLNQAFTWLVERSSFQAVTELDDQSSKQPSSWSIYAINWSNLQRTSWPLIQYQPIDPSVDPSINRSIEQTTNGLSYQVTDHSIDLFLFSANPSYDRWRKRWYSHPINLSFDHRIKRATYYPNNT